MKEGDIIEWEGVRTTQRGQVFQGEDGLLHIRQESGHTFLLNDILSAKSAKLIEQ